MSTVVYIGDCSDCGSDIHSVAPSDASGKMIRCGSCGHINHFDKMVKPSSYDGDDETGVGV